MNLTPDLSSGWSWELIPDNLMWLNFVLLFVFLVTGVFTANHWSQTALRVGALVSFIGLVGLISAWPGHMFFVVLCWIGLCLLVLAGVASMIRQATASKQAAASK